MYRVTEAQVSWEDAKVFLQSALSKIPELRYAAYLTGAHDRLQGKYTRRILADAAVLANKAGA
jgi:hypothetical protein